MRFARRTDWDLAENPQAQTLRQLKAAGADVLDLTESNPTRAGFYYPPEICLGALQDPAALAYAPLPAGLLRAREAVAARLALQGTPVPPDRLLLTASTSEAYSFLFRLLFDPGDRVLVPVPGYPLFSYLADINDIVTAPYRLVFDGTAWRVDLDSLRAAAAGGRARAVIVVSPDNPTGSCLNAGEYAALNEVCTSAGMAVISDEVFADYLFPEVRGRYCSAAANQAVLSFALGGLSKTLALPQMKLAWTAVNGPAADVAAALARLEVIADTYLSVNTPVQHACVRWLPQAAVIQEQIMSRLRANLAVLTAWAPAAGFRVYPVEGGWYAVIRGELSAPEDVWAAQLLKERHVHVHPGYYFDFEDEGNVVLSLLTPAETFRRGLERLQR